MKLDEKIAERLAQLIESGENVANHVDTDSFSSTVDRQKSSQWGVSCLNLLAQVFGNKSDHYQRFARMVDNELYYWRNMVTALGILQAAQDDYEHGYLFDTRRLIEAEVFDDFMEQADYLLNGGYEGPAAVIAGCVLEDGLRKLCHRHSIILGSQPKLDAMNAELAKNGIIDKLTQKRITFLADIRNKAAHGQWSLFTKDDVTGMLRDVRSFMEKHFT